jgi:hypothetical protein
MPGFLLDVGATVICAHSGITTSTAPVARVKVGGKPVLNQVPFVVAGCTLLPQAGGPCATAQAVVGAARVKAMGLPVLLGSTQAVCVPTGTTVTITVSQTRVKGI